MIYFLFVAVFVGGVAVGMFMEKRFICSQLDEFEIQLSEREQHDAGIIGSNFATKRKTSPNYVEKTESPTPPDSSQGHSEGGETNINGSEKIISGGQW